MVVNKLIKQEIDLTKTALCSDFYKFCKNKNDLMIGVELERLPIYRNSFKAVDYFGKGGLYRLLRQFAVFHGWDYISDSTFINGLKHGKNTITLEPGGQLEYSLEAKKSLAQIEADVLALDEKMQPVLDMLGISLLEYPITPITDGLDIEIIPKTRYQTMAKYMGGKKCYSMMRETAGIQVSLDYTDEIDAMKKLKIAMMLSPFVTAMFANSPIRCGKATGYKSYRASAWLETDDSRCGFISEKIFDHAYDFSFYDYVSALFHVPVLFLQRGDEVVEIGGSMNFEDYSYCGYEGFEPTKADFALHSSLFFPEVRLKNIIEIRNQDCQKDKMKYAVPALYKGLLYDDDAVFEVFELLKKLKFEDFSRLRQEVPKTALQTQVGSGFVLDYAREILKIAVCSLEKMGEGEEKFLEPISELLSDGLCPADVLLKDWHGDCGGDIYKFVKKVLGSL